MEGCGLNQGLHKRTKMALLALLPTLSSRIAVVSFFCAPYGISKY